MCHGMMSCQGCEELGLEEMWRCLLHGMCLWVLVLGEAPVLPGHT